MNKSLIRLKRLEYRSGHRGCKETDLIFGAFSQKHLAALTAAQLAAYERLLDEDDANIWVWLTGKDIPQDYAQLIAMMTDFVPDA